MGLIVAAVVVAAAAAGSAYAENEATQSALTEEQKAWNKVKGTDIGKTQKLAADADIAKYRQQFQAQRDIDPKYAALRDSGANGVLDALQQDASGNSTARRSIDALEASSNKNTPAEQSVIEGLLKRAKSDLDAGATLPPEFQAELVRSGFAQAGAAGAPTNGDGGTGTQVRTLLGSAGINLQNQRTQEATLAAGSAGEIQSRRSQILGGLAQLDNNLRSSQFDRAFGASKLGSGSVPNVGLTGADVANLSLNNDALENRRQLALGGINANRALAQGKANSSYIAAGGQAVSGGLGAYSAMETGVPNQYSGGSGSWLQDFYGKGSSYNPNSTLGGANGQNFHP